MGCRLLAAFDFDHTIVEENSDVVARKLIRAEKIPEEVRKLYEAAGWTSYMREVFKLLHINKVTRQQICEAMHNMTPTPGMPELLHWLKSAGHETIIISDSNSVFIEEWLQHQHLHKCVDRVFTNPSSFEGNGLLTLQAYQDQDWCDLSTRNLCKGYILETYIKQRQEDGVSFDVIAYVGDGQNDYCPSLKLGENDFVFPRTGYTLENILNEPERGSRVAAKVTSWSTAEEISNVLQGI